MQNMSREVYFRWCATETKLLHYLILSNNYNKFILVNEEPLMVGEFKFA